MKILVTGSSGFIAGELVPKLLADGHELVGFDLVTPSINYGSRFSFIQGDITDSERVACAMEGVEVIIHMAAEHEDFGVSSGRFFEVNAGGMDVLLQSARTHGVRRLLFYSSVAVYGDRDEPSHEGLEPAPSNPYGASKLEAEKIAERWAVEDPTRQALFLRPTVIFGPHNRANMYRLIDQIAKGRYLQVGSGANIKSTGYVENIAAATVFLLHRMSPGVEIYNYADRPHLTSGEITAAIAQGLGKRIPRIRIPRRGAMLLAFPMDVLAAIFGRNLPITAKRISKLTATTHHSGSKLRETGFSPRYDTFQALAKMVEWYRSQTAN